MRSLDPRNPADKGRMKASIVDSIAMDVAGADRQLIAERVDVEFERLLGGAAVVTHVASLTAGNVRRELRRNGH